MAQFWPYHAHGETMIWSRKNVLSIWWSLERPFYGLILSNGWSRKRPITKDLPLSERQRAGSFFTINAMKCRRKRCVTGHRQGHFTTFNSVSFGTKICWKIPKFFAHKWGEKLQFSTMLKISTRNTLKIEKFSTRILRINQRISLATVRLRSHRRQKQKQDKYSSHALRRGRHSRRLFLSLRLRSIELFSSPSGFRVPGGLSTHFTECVSGCAGKNRGLKPL